MNQSEKISNYAYIRAISCIAIIILHLFGSVSILYEGVITINQNAVARIISNCMNWAVPCFVMTSGALLLDPKREISFLKIKKYVIRILGALIAFSIIFRLFDAIMDGEKVGISTLIHAFYEMITGTGWSHLWYLYMLLGLYLLLPFYRKILKYSSERELKYLMAVCVGFLAVFPILRIWNVNIGFYIHVGTIYPLYLFCGYALHNRIIKIDKKIAAFMIVISMAFIATMTYIRWTTFNEALEILWSYSSLGVIVCSIGVFSLIDGLQAAKQRGLHKILIEIDKYSFGIYLIHMIYVRLILRYWGFNPYDNHAALSYALLLVMILIVSYVSVWLMKKIPFIKRIL